MQKTPWFWQSSPQIHQWTNSKAALIPKMTGVYSAEIYMSDIKFVLPKEWSFVTNLKMAVTQANCYLGICIKTRKTIYYFKPAVMPTGPAVTCEIKTKFDDPCSTSYLSDIVCPIDNLSQVGIFSYAAADPLPRLDPSCQIKVTWELYSIDKEVPLSLLTHRFAPGGQFISEKFGVPPLKFIGRSLEGLYAVEKQGQKLFMKPEEILPEYTYNMPIIPEAIVTHSAAEVFKEGTQGPSLLEFMIKKLWTQTVQGVPIMEILLALTDRDGLWFPVYITGGSVRDYLLGKEPNDIDLVVGGSYSDVRNRIQTFFANIGKPLTDETLRTDTLTQSFGQMKIMNVNGEPEPLDIALFKCAKIDAPNSGSKYAFGFSCLGDTKFRDYTFNAMYLDVFTNRLYYMGSALDDAKKLFLRVVDQDEFVKNDLGGQLRLWKMLKGDDRLRTYDTNTFNVKNYVSALLHDRIGTIYKSSVPEAVKEGVAFFVKMRKKLFKDLKSVTKTAKDWHVYFEKITPQDSMVMDNAITGWWWNMMDFIDGKSPFNTDNGLRRKTIMASLPQDVAIVLEILKTTRPVRRGMDAPENRSVAADATENRSVAADATENRSVADVRDVDLSAASAELQRVVHVNSQIATNPDLQNLRTQDKVLFDSFIKHAVPFALQSAVLSVNAIKAAQRGKRNIGVDIAVEQHLPTAINFAQQVTALPEVIENRGLFSKIFSIGMPLVLNTAQTLLGAKRNLGDATSDRGFFDSILANLPSTVFSALSNGIIQKRALGDDRDLGEEGRALGEEGRDLGEGRGFFDFLKKVAPIVLNVASTAASSFGGQRSLSTVPTDRGFFSTLKSVVSKVLSNPGVQKLGSAALEVGKQVAATSSFNAMFDATGFLGGNRAIEDKLPPTPEQTEANARGFFATMLQHLTPIALNAAKGALSGAVAAVANRDVRDLPEERGLFDFVSKYLPAAIQVSHEAFYQKRNIGTTPEDQAKYLERALIALTPSIIQAATNKNTETDLTKLVADIAL